MARKSSIEKLPTDVRTHIEKRMRENRLTLDELIDDLRSHFPADEKPSRSSLGRYKQSFDTLTARMREQDAMARMLVEELGENPDEKAGALLVQSITTLATQAAFTAQEGEDIDVKDIGRLARAAKDIMHTRKLTREERHQIRKDAQEELLKEQETRLEEMRGTDGMSEQLENRIRNILLGKA
jgi:hypothetical protein